MLLSTEFEKRYFFVCKKKKREDEKIHPSFYFLLLGFLLLGYFLIFRMGIGIVPIESSIPIPIPILNIHKFVLFSICTVTIFIVFQYSFFLYYRK
nr:ribosomal protein L32 [Euphorbia kansuensis]